MEGIYLIACESFFGFEGGVEHHVCIGGGKTVGDYLEVDHAVDLAVESFESALCFCTCFCFFLFGEGFLEFPEDDMLYHNQIPFGYVN